MITHSLGELDSLFPLFAAVKAKYDVDVKIIFAVNRIYRQFESNDFYRFCARQLSIQTIKCQLPNKFDYREGFYAGRLGRLFVKIYFRLLKIVKYPYLLPKLLWADAYMHEISNQLSSTSILYWFKKNNNKKIFSYHHGQGIIKDIIPTKKVAKAKDVIHLGFHEHNKQSLFKAGFEHQFIIGYPKFYSEWLTIVRQYNNSEFMGKEIALICSRHVHPFYMDEDKYIKLLLTSCKVIRRKMGNILIVIKPHPRENTELINKILKGENILNTYISREHVVVLAKSARLAISFWGSAILDGLSLGVPSIEFYEEANRFREAEPKGSSYKNVGIDSTDNERGLAEFIDSVLKHDYKTPKIINEFYDIKDVSFVNNIGE